MAKSYAKTYSEKKSLIKKENISSFQQDVVSEADKKKILKAVDRREEARSFRQTYQDRWHRYMDLIDNIYEPDDEDSRDHGRNISIPEAQGEFRSILAYITAPYEEGKDYLHVYPVDENDMDNFKNMEMGLRQFAKDMDFRDVIYDLAFDQVGMGSMVLIGGWERLKDVQKIETPDGQVLEEEVTVYDGPTGDAENLENVYFDPKAWKMGKMGYVIHEKFMSREEIEGRVKAGEFDKKVLRHLDNLKFQVITNPDMETKSQEPGQADTNLDETPHEFLVSYMWTRKRLFVWCNDAVVFANKKNEYYKDKRKRSIPVFVGQFFRIPRRLYGHSIFHSIEDFQYAINCMVNALLDNLTYVVRPALQGPRGIFDEEDEEDLELSTGDVWEVDGGEIKTISIPPVIGEIWNVISAFRQIMISNTNATDQIRGLPSQGKETATMGLKKQEAAKIIIGMAARNLARLLKEFWEFQKDNVDKFLQAPIKRRFQDEQGEYKFERLDRAALKGKFEVRVQIDPTGQSQALKVEQLMRFSERYGNFPWFDMRELAKRTGEHMDLKQVEKLVLNDDSLFMKMLRENLVPAQVQQMIPRVMALITSQTPEEFAQKFYEMMGQAQQMGQQQPGQPPVAPQMGGVPAGVQSDVFNQGDVARVLSPGQMAGEDQFMQAQAGQEAMQQ